MEPGEKNYIYIEYKEEEKEPIPNFANGSSDETFYSNRIEETFQISISTEPPENIEDETDTETILDASNESLAALVNQYKVKFYVLVTNFAFHHN